MATITGTNGTNGEAGANGIGVQGQAGGDGGSGTDGTAGESLGDSLSGALDANYIYTAGSGGAGGHGGKGADGSGEGWYDAGAYTYYTQYLGGDAGNGANAATAGSVAVTATAATSVSGLYIQTFGGSAGKGGNGNNGGSAGWSDARYSLVDPTDLESIINGAAGGDGGNGGNGGDSGNSGISITGGLIGGGGLILKAWGGFDGNTFGSGGDGGNAGSGATAGHAGNGGRGGNGGSAAVEAENNTLVFNASHSLSATGAIGYEGGKGGNGSEGVHLYGYTSGGIYQTDTVYSDGGYGGAGGDGGSATIDFVDNDITGTGASEELAIDIKLVTDRGGYGGLAGSTLSGTPLDGGNGTMGDAGVSSFTFSGNAIDGGEGTDTFTFSLYRTTFEVSTYQAVGAVYIDLSTGVFNIGSDENSIANVENITLSGMTDGYYIGANFYSQLLGATLIGTDQANRLYASAGNDTLDGGGGDDRLNPGTGVDTVDGGAGTDIVTLDLGAVSYNVSVNLAAMATSSGTDIGNGTVIKNVERIDYMTTGTGADSLTIGETVDFYWWQAGSGSDRLIVDRGAATTGIDAYQSGASYVVGSFSASQIEGVTVTTGSAIDHVYGLNLAGSNDIISTGGNDDWLLGGKGNDTLNGGEGIDTVNYQLADSAVTVSLAKQNQWQNTLGEDSDYLVSIENLLGSSHNDTFTGSSGNNVLDGYTGSDLMKGGLGNDTYYVDDLGDVVKEESSQGTDVVFSSVNFALTGESIEVLNLTGSANLTALGNTAANTLNGNSGNNVLDGWGGADKMAGGLGNDTYYVDNVGDKVTEGSSQGTDVLYASVSFALTGESIEVLNLTGSANINALGNTAANTLNGNSGNNVLDGWGGADKMAGGLGNDTYYVDNAGDKVTEGSSQGTDVVYASVSFALTGESIEVLNLTGPTNINALGNTAANTLNGNSGNNVLDGWGGADKMAGGLGNDTYHVDNIGDKVTEQSSEGTDVVYASVSFALTGESIEVLNLTGSANINALGNTAANTLNGNSGNNVLDGWGGADKMAGGLGNDTYYVDNVGDKVTEESSEGTDVVVSSVSFALTGESIEVLNLTGTANINGLGNTAANTLNGSSGNNVLDGWGGADKMAGGLGNDTYYVDNIGDKVTEESSQGTDVVFSSVTFALTGESIEVLNLTGSANINALGNTSANTLNGNSGNNVLDGWGGADKMAGGLGNDTYYVDNIGDKVIEESSEGTDVVFSSVSFVLTGESIEVLNLTGSGNINALGNTAKNTLTGNSGNNVLDGHQGADTLTGNGGSDTFLFNLASGADTITDFSAAQGDLIDVHAYNAQSTALITQLGSNTRIDLGGGNVITVANTLATDAAFLSHIVW